MEERLKERGRVGKMEMMRGGWRRKRRGWSGRKDGCRRGGTEGEGGGVDAG